MTVKNRLKLFNRELTLIPSTFYPQRAMLSGYLIGNIGSTTFVLAIEHF
jgi:hypothetical protein